MNGIELTDLVIDVEATVGNVLFAKAAYPTFAYEKGVPTSTRDGTRYRVITPVGGINIKVKGPQTLNVDGSKSVPVYFDGLELYIYFRDGTPVIAGRARAVKVADKGT